MVEQVLVICLSLRMPALEVLHNCGTLKVVSIFFSSIPYVTLLFPLYCRVVGAQTPSAKVSQPLITSCRDPDLFVAKAYMLSCDPDLYLGQATLTWARHGAEKQNKPWIHVGIVQI